MGEKVWGENILTCLLRAQRTSSSVLVPAEDHWCQPKTTGAVRRPCRWPRPPSSPQVRRSLSCCSLQGRSRASRVCRRSSRDATRQSCAMAAALCRCLPAGPFSSQRGSMPRRSRRVVQTVWNLWSSRRVSARCVPARCPLAVASC